MEFTRQQALLRIGRAALLPQGTLSAALAEHRKSVRPLHKALPILR